MIEVWTDGACDPNPGHGGWGWTRSDGVEACGGDAETTNNRMELFAILDAIRAIPIGVKAKVWSDSRYCVDGMNSWRHSWKRRGWARRRDPVKNLDLWKALDAEANRRRLVEFAWVRGHNGNPGNERADELAEIGRAQAIDVAKVNDYLPPALEGMLIV